DLVCLLLGLRERGKQQRGQNCDDRNHHQKLDQREAPSNALRTTVCMARHYTHSLSRCILKIRSKPRTFHRTTPPAARNTAPSGNSRLNRSASTRSKASSPTSVSVRSPRAF